MLVFKIPGEPIAKGRPRVTKYGTHTPEKTKNYETLVKEMFAITYGQPLLENPLEINLKLYFSIPKSASKIKKNLMENGNIRPIKRPDLDNCMKSITDALNGIAYKDDSQIIKATVEKYYSEVPRAEVVIKELEL
ncbi:RusA family crossover junction endodeoxyribonuclease [Anaerophilus nitritogenes]|uniref:RusA family crossover junction endodeoxyribonuclease n=1 Tax=Anaerophilus nitritogenes TaxID=2498136 RepID=UPI00101D94AD|nr:RusA family crossover junction endodeoxyribonuclease [Anaerophilus nitritogenes]